jgi:ribosome-binding factor A
MRLFRPERIGSVIQEEIAQMIVRDVEVPGGLITVIGVDVDKKIEHARVRVSILPPSFEAAALRKLNMRIGEFQHALNRKMGIRPMPLISFLIDRGNENAARVDTLLKEH